MPQRESTYDLFVANLPAENMAEADVSFRAIWAPPNR